MGEAELLVDIVLFEVEDDIPIFEENAESLVEDLTRYPGHRRASSAGQLASCTDMHGLQRNCRSFFDWEVLTIVCLS